VSNPLSDAVGIMKKDWKLLAGLNALYFCVVVIGAVMALISPGLHLSMIQYIGAETIGGPLSTAPPADTREALMDAGYSLASSLFVNTLAMITAPSVILPLWAPIIGASRFFIWGVAYVSPLEGVLTLGDILPQYVAMLLEGEAYVIAIFACVRQMAVALTNMNIGFRPMLRKYGDSVVENLKLLLVVVLLLAAAALYQAFVIPALYNIL
jgi:hypothetical protein